MRAKTKRIAAGEDEEEERMGKTITIGKIGHDGTMMWSCETPMKKVHTGTSAAVIVGSETAAEAMTRNGKETAMIVIVIDGGTTGQIENIADEDGTILRNTTIEETRREDVGAGIEVDHLDDDKTTALLKLCIQDLAKSALETIGGSTEAYFDSIYFIRLLFSEQDPSCACLNP